jgi:hypothetical protein
MSKPSDIPQWAWDKAVQCLGYGGGNELAGVIRAQRINIARALMAERERAAKIAEDEPEFPESADENTQKALDENSPLTVARIACHMTKEAIAAAIRKDGA